MTMLEQASQDSAASTAASFTWRGALAGARDALPYAPSAFVFGIVFGLAAREVGLSLAESLLMSAIVFGGSAQLLALSIWSTPPELLALVFATLAISSRFLLMSATMRPWFGQLPKRIAYPMLYFLVDAGWLLALRARDKGRHDAAHLLGSGLVFYVGWVVATWLGHSGGSLLGDPRDLGLDFLLIAFFAAILASTWRGRADLWPWGVAAAVSLLGAWLLPGAWYVLLGGLAGSFVGVARDGR